MATTGVRVTWDEFLARRPESRLSEWVSGDVVEHAPPLRRHQDLAGFLFEMLHLFAQLFRLGTVLVAPFAMRLSAEGPGREPDVLFVANDHLDRLLSTHLEGPADLAVEVVSEDSAARDRVEKFDEYQQAGIREYWVIDARPGRERADFWVLDPQGRYCNVAPGSDGVYRSAAVPGFWLRVDWLPGKDLPEAGETFMEIAGLPAATIEALRRAKARGPRDDPH